MQLSVVLLVVFIGYSQAQTNSWSSQASSSGGTGFDSLLSNPMLTAALLGGEGFGADRLTGFEALMGRRGRLGNAGGSGMGGTANAGGAGLFGAISNLIRMYGGGSALGEMGMAGMGGMGGAGKNF